MSDSLEERAARLPTSSGVYLFKDPRGVVLYVGKAINLRARVRQYLSGGDERFMVRFLVAQAADVDVVLTGTEKEALILENTLIKRHRPPYNVKLRDDKNFLHLRIDPRQKWPQYALVRRIRDDGTRTFGPYSSAQKARRTLTFLQRAFPLRTCSDQVLNSRRRPCLLHQMGRCVAPCVDGHTTKAEYDELVQESMLLLQGRRRDLVDRLRERMGQAAETLEFEKAARLRDLIREIEVTTERQTVVDRKLGDRDAWGIFREGHRAVVAIVPTREGMMMEPTYLELEGAVGDTEELLSSWLNAAYSSDRFIPPEVLLPVLPVSPEALTEVLSERRDAKVRMLVPQRGDKVRVLELAQANARDRLRRSSDPGARRAAGLERLAEVLGLEAPPHRIECFDNSNIQGEQPVASNVVFLDGAPAKREYRHYKIKTVVGADDYASMAEVLERRFRRAAEEGVFPDLVVVDGGKGQLNAALKALAELGFEDQAVIGLAKPRTEKRRGEFDAVDKIVIPGADEVLRLEDNDLALNMLRHIRDESHRFAIGFHRRTRRKSKLGSVLEAIPGVGGKRRKALLKHFGSAKALVGATAPEIEAVDGIGPKMAQQIWSELHPEG